ncbi:MAG: pyridoxal-dependent decarboxylase, exosortase A system-associated [Acidobacteria bacterium]|nr:pyridoxal-dependent decarboxylase, exosortase A system-associated [Acidobacteriota bacterium]
MTTSVAPVDAQVEMLGRVARLHGTPCYAYDLARLRRQIGLLKSHLPPDVEVLYSLKANPSPAVCRLLAAEGFGADVVSVGELSLALGTGFTGRRILAGGPYKPTEMLARLAALPGALLSLDSVSEAEELSRCGLPLRVILRLRPDFPSSAVMGLGPGSRFGIAFEDLPRCHEILRTGSLTLAGFHVFAGSQTLDPAAVVRHLRQSLDLSLRAADRLGCEPEVLDLGGGFGVPYTARDQELPLELIGEELGSLCDRAAPGRIVLELGRYLVAQAGWYLTRVVAHQALPGRSAVVVDGGTHQRADLCGLNLRARGVPPVVLPPRPGLPLEPTDVLGCLCLSEDVLAEASPLPALARGDVLAFPNAGAYGLSASPFLFLGHPSPAEVAFEDGEIELLQAPGASTMNVAELAGAAGAPPAWKELWP